MLSDDELLESIARKSRMIMMLSKQRGALIREGQRREIDNDVLNEAQRVHNSTTQKKRRTKEVT